MDVTTINTTYPAATQVPAQMSAVNAEASITALHSKQETAEKVMMDLQDVQNFLYMLIGSEIRVESDNRTIGASINTVA